MIKWRNRKAPTPATPDAMPQDGLFSRLKQGLSKTTEHLGDGLRRVLLGKKEIDAAVLENLETLLLSADLGVQTTQMLLDRITHELHRQALKDGEAVLMCLKQAMLACLQVPVHTNAVTPMVRVILMVGVNGAGKTTTIGKLAQCYRQQGKTVMLAAGDTFRAAAIEQLQAWGLRNEVSVIAQHAGADSASVIFDAFQAAKARHVDVLIADTAGRLHTQHHLMEELKKIKRVLQKIDPEAPHEVMLVLDAIIVQNALHQAREFHQALGVTGITLTKLDGTAKGGIVFAIAHELQIPLCYLGTGEGLGDLRTFDAHQFVNAIFDDDPI